MKRADRSVDLGEVAEFIRGVTFKPDDVVSPVHEGAVACMRTKNIQSEIDLSDVWGIPTIFVKREDQFLKDGDILVSTANSFEIVGKCCWVENLPYKSTFGGFISALRPVGNSVDPRYLYRVFSSERMQSEVRRCARKTTSIANLSLDQCLALRIPLPPLAEQRRIAAILDQADDLRRKRRAALERTDDVIKALFADLSTRDGSAARAPTTLKDIIKIRSGDFLPKKDQAETGHYPVFGGNGITGHHDAFNIDADTLIIGRVGVYCGSVYISSCRSWVTDNAFIVETKNDSINKTYILYALRIANLNQYAGRSAQPLLSGSRIYPVEIPIPPLPLQRAFAARVAEIDALKAHHRAHLQKLDALFASLQHRAFRGEL